jgi:Tol biopolymer transport system component
VYDYGWTSWTPDGERIVTQVADENGFTRVTVLGADGREIDGFGAGRGGMADAVGPVVSPDGRRVAYAVITPSQSWHVRVRPLDGSGEDVELDEEFVGGAASLRWSPDGRLLVVNHHFYPGTWLLDPDGGPARQASWTDPGFAAWQRTAR